MRFSSSVAMVVAFLMLLAAAAHADSSVPAGSGLQAVTARVDLAQMRLR